MKSMFAHEYIFGLSGMATYTGYSHMEMSRRIRDGRLPAEKTGHQWAVRRSDLDPLREMARERRARLGW